MKSELAIIAFLGVFVAGLGCVIGRSPSAQERSLKFMVTHTASEVREYEPSPWLRRSSSPTPQAIEDRHFDKCGTK
jgi:hypothetical protein